MGNWVEELKPEDDVQVEIVYPVWYAERNLRTIGKYSASIAMRCKAAALLEEDVAEFLISGMTIIQVHIVEEAMKKFGIKLTHSLRRIDGVNHVLFCADVRDLQEKMKRGEVE